MVSSMELERSGAVEIVDKDSTQTLSAVSQRSVDIKIIPTIVTENKKDLKLRLSQRLEKCSIEDDEKTSRPDIKSPKSPRTPMSPKSPLSNSSRSFERGSTLIHQSSKTSQIDVVDDRKALRDALYQGIFHRHRRTIFAVGSFLRMLKTRNSQYNTIRSTSDLDEDTR
ncbi:hypothetical protein HA402_012428 [Bradysia odoriphaga]|nr:hypothetical protein HA402_012428 [Bradysia odoriphaga]